MKLSKRILSAINEGVSTALMLDNTDIPNIIRKSSALISNDVKLNTEKVLYSRKLLESLPDPMDVDKEFIDVALELYRDYGVLYNPHLNGEKFRKFIEKCIEIQGDEANLNWICTSDVTDMKFLFMENSNFNCDISKWDVSNVKNMYEMFCDCHNFNCDISNWDVSNVTNMSDMFYNCSKFNQNISNWDVSNVINMNAMFNGCIAFKQDISKWDVSNVKNCYRMFYGCKMSLLSKYKPKFNNLV